MAFTKVALLSLLYAFASALPSAVVDTTPAGHEWKAPGPWDVRSPCPGLNSLANHGFLPRSGKGMTIPILVAGGAKGLTMGVDFMTAIGGAGILSSPNPAGGSFDLDNLDEHNFPIEHDASLSRQDHYFGQWYNLNKRSYEQWISYFGDATETSITSAAMAKYTRVNDSLTRDPDVAYGPREFVLSYGETGLYLQTMGRSIISGVAPLSYIRMFFLEERLPYILGWTKPDVLNTVTLPSLAAMAVELNAASGEALPEGLEVLSVGAFRDAFEGINPVTGKLGNITGA